MYGPVTSIRGPGTAPESIIALRLRSVYGSMLPAVRIVVAPPARYNFGKLYAFSL